MLSSPAINGRANSGLVAESPYGLCICARFFVIGRRDIRVPRIIARQECRAYHTFLFLRKEKYAKEKHTPLAALAGENARTVVRAKEISFCLLFLFLKKK